MGRGTGGGRGEEMKRCGEKGVGKGRSEKKGE